MENLREKDYYKQKIIEMVERINNQDILGYIYIIVKDIIKEDKEKGNEE